MYGDSQGSPDQDSHFDPSAAFEAVPAGVDSIEATNVLPPMDVKVAGSPPDAAGAAGAAEAGPVWSPSEIEHPAPGSGRNPVVKTTVIAAAVALMVGGGAVAAFALSDGSGSTGKKISAAPPPTQAVLADPDKPTPSIDADATRKLVMDRASRAARGAAKAPAMSAKGATPTPSRSPGSTAPASAGNPMPAGEAQTLARGMMSASPYNWDPDTQFGCLKNLWAKESGWRVTAGNSSGAYGLPQALPGSKMAAYGADWRTSAKTQITWGFHYILGRYSTPCKAWATWQGQHWY